MYAPAADRRGRQQRVATCRMPPVLAWTRWMAGLEMRIGRQAAMTRSSVPRAAFLGAAIQDIVGQAFSW